MAIWLPERDVWTRQPDHGVADIAYSNPITRGLVAAIDPHSGRNLVSKKPATVHNAKPHLIGHYGRVAGFYNTLGYGGSDRIETDVTASSQQVTLAFWHLRNGQGEGNLGRMLNKNGEFDVLYTFASGANYQIYRTTTGSRGSWYTADPPTGGWYHFAVSLDSSSASNDPVMYMGGVPQTIAETETPTGVGASSSNPWFIGNVDALTRTWDGYIGLVLIWHRILSDAEVRSIYQNQWQIFE